MKVENVNCIAVEWKRGVKALYAVAANNARVVAAQVASMITFLMVNTALPPTEKTLHMVKTNRNPD